MPGKMNVSGKNSALIPLLGPISDRYPNAYTEELRALSPAGRPAGDAEQGLNVPVAVPPRFGTCTIIAPVSRHSPSLSRHARSHFYGLFCPSGHSLGQFRPKCQTMPSRWHNYSPGSMP